MIVFLILAVVWAAVLLPPFLRNRREGRPADSVSSFRQHLHTLERTSPGTSSYRPLPRPALGPGGSPVGRAAVRKRRRDILFGLGGATGISLLLAVSMGGLGVVMFVISAILLASYTGLLIQIQKRTAEREAKVRVLAPQRRLEPVYDLRRSASN